MHNKLVYVMNQPLNLQYSKTSQSEQFHVNLY